VPDPQFSASTTPTRHRLRPISGPGPLAVSGGTLDFHRRTGSSVGPLRWARCPDDGCLHLLQLADVTTADHARALWGRFLPVEGLTLTHGSSGALCMTCITGSPPHLHKRQSDEHRPRDPRQAPAKTSPPPCGRSAINQPLTEATAATAGLPLTPFPFFLVLDKPAASRLPIRSVDTDTQFRYDDMFCATHRLCFLYKLSSTKMDTPAGLKSKNL
jgi:hypothetical protein